MCHVSRVMCQVSPVIFHMSHVKKNLKNKEIKIKLYPSEKIGQSDRASQWRVCYQRGLPRLVFFSQNHYSCQKLWQ